MKIDNIRLTHFKRFERVDIPIDAGFISVTGKNGSGKSTLLNAFKFALYGVSGGLSADHIVSSFAEPGERCEVELDFTYDGMKYNVLRTFKKNKSVQHDATIRCNGEIRATGVSQVKAEARRIIGLSDEDFDMVVYSKQDDMRAITDITPGKRKEWFSKAGGVDFIKTGSDKALKERAAKIEQAIATSQGELAALSRQDPTELDKTREDLKVLRNGIAALKVEETEKQNTRAIFSAQKQEYDLKTVQQSKLADQHNTLLFDIDALQKRIETLGVQLGSLTINEGDLTQAEEASRGIPQARLDIEEYRTKKTEVERIAVEQKAWGKIETLNMERRDKLAAQLADLTRAEKELEELQTTVRKALRVEDDADVDTAVTDYQQYVTEKITNLNARINGNEEARIKIATALETVRELGPEGTCPICFQRLGDHFSDVEKEYLARIADAISEHGQMDEALDAALQDSHTIPDLKPTLDRIRQLRISLGYREILEHERKEAHEKSLEGSGKMVALIREFEAVGYNEEDHLACKDNLAKLEAAQTRYTELTKRSAEQAGIRAQVAEINSQVTTKNATRAEVKAAIDANPINLTDGPRLTHEIEKLDISLKSIGQDLATSIERERTLAQKLTDLEIAAASIGTVQQQLATLKAELEVLTLTRAAISDYSLYLMQVMRSAIEAEASGILADITDGKYSREIIDEEFNILIQEGDKEYTLDRYSGGEQDVIALSLRMALSNILPKLRGVYETFPFLIDEGLASLDPERKENTIRAMRVQSKICGQVINISHDQDVVGDHTLVVSTKGPVSTVQAGV